MVSNHDSQPATTNPDGLQRTLKDRHIQLIAIGGAIGTGLFMGSGRIISLAGPSILLVYTISGIMLFLFMRCMGEIFLAKPELRSFADIATHYLGPWGGILLSWTYWMCWTGAAIADMVAITGYFRFWWPTLPLWIPVVGAVALLFFLNALTVKAFGETEFWFALIKVFAIIALILVGVGMVVLGHVGEDGARATVANLWEHGGFFPTGFMGFVVGFQIAVYAFAGVELVGTTVAESEDPQKSLPKAINTIPLRIIIFYVGALAVIMMVDPWTKIDPHTSPFVTMFTAAGLPAAASFINLVVITSAASSGNSGVYSTSRMIYGLARVGEAPRFFNKLSKNHVPRNALLLTSVLMLSSIVLMYVGGSVMEAFTLVSAACSVLFMSVWALITYSYVRYRKLDDAAHQASTFKVPGGLISAWGVLAFFGAVAMVQLLSPDTRLPFAAASVWLIVVGGTAIYRQHTGYVDKPLLQKHRP